MKNPFDIPGMMGAGGDSGDHSKNPIFASLDMMRSVWESMGGSGFAGVGDSSAAFLAPEELETRIRDLRAIENWLKLNLSMLESTIQGLEIQKATLSTVQSLLNERHRWRVCRMQVLPLMIRRKTLLKRRQRRNPRRHGGG